MPSMLPDNLIHCYNYCTVCTITVSGEANFTMNHTGLTVGGFIQPSVARNMIEAQGNVEEGLCQRFPWLIPQPVNTSFAQLEQVDKTFTSTMGRYH